jgi:hypothetical protein
VTLTETISCVKRCASPSSPRAKRDKPPGQSLVKHMRTTSFAQDAVPSGGRSPARCINFYSHLHAESQLMTHCVTVYRPASHGKLKQGRASGGKRSSAARAVTNGKGETGQMRQSRPRVQTMDCRLCLQHLRARSQLAWLAAKPIFRSRGHTDAKNSDALLSYRYMLALRFISALRYHYMSPPACYSRKSLGSFLSRRGAGNCRTSIRVDGLSVDAAISSFPEDRARHAEGACA